MSERIEKLLKDYPKLVQQRDCVALQLAHFKGVSAEEVIESMYTPRMDGERVQSSNLSDKTAQIALNYRERQQNINQDWYAHLEMRLQLLNDEIVFLKSALQSCRESSLRSCGTWSSKSRNGAQSRRNTTSAIRHSTACGKRRFNSLPHFMKLTTQR